MRKAFLSVALLLVLLAPRLSVAQTPLFVDEVVADLSNHLVAIDVGFAGTKVLLFGATEGEGDVVVVVKGPSTEKVVRKKERILGVWANNEQVAFSDTPAFMVTAGSQPIADIVDPILAARYELGPDHLKARPADETMLEQNWAPFWAALVRNKREQGLYSITETPVTFLGNRLFRTDIYLPANIPVGTYLVNVYLVRDKQVTSAISTPLVVSKTGIEAGIFNFAHRHSFAYGVVAVLIAVFAGWLAGVIFRK